MIVVVNRIRPRISVSESTDSCTCRHFLGLSNCVCVCVLFCVLSLIVPIARWIWLTSLRLRRVLSVSEEAILRQVVVAGKVDNRVGALVSVDSIVVLPTGRLVSLREIFSVNLNPYIGEWSGASLAAGDSFPDPTFLFCEAALASTGNLPDILLSVSVQDSVLGLAFSAADPVALLFGSCR